MIVISGGVVIDPSQDLEAERDVLIKEGRIEGIDRPGAFSGLKGAEKIDASGCWVTPGLIDAHVHLREPGFEWKETIESGTQAAALGGYTAVCCMANTRPVNDHAEITRFIRERAEASRAARVFPIGAVSKGLEGKEMAPLSELRKAGAAGFSDDGHPVYDALLMRRALEWATMLDAPICCHEEDKNLVSGGCMNESALSLRIGLRGMPKAGEDVMIARDIELARLTGGHVHICHVSSARAVELIRRAKAEGIKITAECTPHHLLLTEERVREYDTNAKMNPPLREAADCDALQKGLAEGVIDIVASDHAPHERDTKDVEFDKASFGMIGLQTTLPLVLGLVRDGKISRSRAIEACSIAPAKVFRLAGLGSLTKGAFADVTVIDPDKAWKLTRARIRSLSANTPFLDGDMAGIAKHVLVAGRVVVKNEELG